MEQIDLNALIKDIWLWATLNLSPASVILFIISILVSVVLVYLLIELRKADKKLNEESKLRIDKLELAIEACHRERELAHKEYASLALETEKLKLRVDMLIKQLDSKEGDLKAVVALIQRLNKAQEAVADA